MRTGEILAIVPARLGSKGVVGKNFLYLGDKTLVAHACAVGREAGCRVVVTSDASVMQQLEWGCNADEYLVRDDELASDTAPMIDVVRDVLQRVPHGDPVVLLQCTQPLRTPAHIREAVRLLRETQADSVVSVVELPKTHSPEFVLKIWTPSRPVLDDGPPYPPRLTQWIVDEEYGYGWEDMPTRRQDVKPSYIRDGTVYAFYRRTVTRHGNIYGPNSQALIIAPKDTCELDTEADWAALEARWSARAAAP